jgi:uncharacterized spore protein YtfJ
MQDMEFSGEGIVSQILDRVKNTVRVDIVYGESRELHGKTIIPVAAVAYVFAGGASAGVNPSGNGASEQVGRGSGGAGAVRVLPVGVLEVSDDETRLVPVLDWTRIITTSLTVFGVWMVLRTVFRRRK